VGNDESLDNREETNREKKDFMSRQKSNAGRSYLNTYGKSRGCMNRMFE